MSATLIVHFIYHSSEVFNQAPLEITIAFGLFITSQPKSIYTRHLHHLSLVHYSLFTLVVLTPLFPILSKAASNPEEYLGDDQEEGDDDEEEGGHPGVPRWSPEQLVHPHRDGLKSKSGLNPSFIEFPTQGTTQ